MRAALLRDGRSMIEGLLNNPELLPKDEPARPHETRYRKRPRIVQTLFGPITILRSYYHHQRAKRGRAPLDETLDLVRGHTPQLAKLICRAATTSASYSEAATDLCAYSGLKLDARGFGRLVAEVAPTLRQAQASLPTPTPKNGPVKVLYVSSDGTGVPIRRAELAGVKGKQSDGSAHTREAKLGCVFTQTQTNEKGEPMRDHDSTSYVGTFEDCRVAGNLLRQEALRRGYGSAEQVVYLGDGAAWVWENARLNFKGAVEILDFYHASEHLGSLAQGVSGKDNQAAKDLQSRWCHQLKASDSTSIIAEAQAALESQAVSSPENQQQVQREIDYFTTHAQRTRYGDYQRKGLFIGSGVVEAGCKTVVGRRLKQSGMFWSQRGGEDLLSLRCLILGPQFDQAWNARLPILAQQRKKARRWSSTQN